MTLLIAILLISGFKLDPLWYIIACLIWYLHIQWYIDLIKITPKSNEGVEDDKNSKE
jgi:hypothetical protein